MEQFPPYTEPVNFLCLRAGGRRHGSGAAVIVSPAPPGRVKARLLMCELPRCARLCARTLILAVSGKRQPSLL